MGVNDQGVVKRERDEGKNATITMLRRLFSLTNGQFSSCERLRALSSSALPVAPL